MLLRTFDLIGLAIALTIVSLGGFDSPAHAKDVWTDTTDSTLPLDFKLQGEYEGEVAGTGKVGVQVISLGGGSLQAVLHFGGLPGQGWDGKRKSLLDGKIEGEKARFVAASGKKTYIAQSPEHFSATEKFPPEGQTAFAGSISGEEFTIEAEGKSAVLKKSNRQSPTLGAKAPEGAIVLFDGKNKVEFNGGRLDEKSGFLNTDGHDILTKRKFRSYTMHLEFVLPYRPAARGQGRGNSGFYQVDHYEVQILDSFGLDGKNNECGGVYTLAEPKVNMCLPPLAWQTYDVEFTAAETGADGKKTKNARLKCTHNGVVIHEDLELKTVTGGSRGEPEGTPGPIKLQGHGNPLQFRNIWIVEKK